MTGATMKSVVIVVVFLALSCSPTSAAESEIETEFLKLNLTSLRRWLKADKYELLREFDQLGVADELGGIMVVVAEILLVLTVLLLWGIFAFLAAVVTVGGTLLDVIVGVISTNFQDVLDFARDWAYEILPPVVNPMLDNVDTPKLAKLLDDTLPSSKAVIMAAVLVVILVVTIFAIFGMSIYILLKVKNSPSRCCCGGKECKGIVQIASNNNE